MLSSAHNELAISVRDWSHVFSNYQVVDGSVDGTHADHIHAQTALEQAASSYTKLCTSIGGRALDCAEIFNADFESWVNRGIENTPDFSATHTNWRPSESPDEFIPLLAPLRVPNGIRSSAFILNFAVTKQVPSTTESVVSKATAQIANPQDIAAVEAPVRSIGFSGGDGSVFFGINGFKNAQGASNLRSFCGI